jgi:hypothetical protein
MKLKLNGVFALLLAATCGLSSCSFFGGKKKRTTRLSESTLLPRDAPELGSSGPSLGVSPQSRR